MFTGHLYHARSGLYFAAFRAYDPELGRWISKDPIDIAGGINLYAYVEGDLVNWVDLLGLTTGRKPREEQYRPRNERGFWVPVSPFDDKIPGGGVFYPDDVGDGQANPDGDHLIDEDDPFPDNGKLPEGPGNTEPYTQEDRVDDLFWSEFGPDLGSSIGWGMAIGGTGFSPNPYVAVGAFLFGLNWSANCDKAYRDHIPDHRPQ